MTILNELNTSSFRAFYQWISVAVFKLVELQYMHSFHPHPDTYMLMKTFSHSLCKNNQRKSVGPCRFDWLYFRIVMSKVALAVTDFSVCIKQHCSIVAWPWLWLQNQCWLYILTCEHEQWRDTRCFHRLSAQCKKLHCSCDTPKCANFHLDINSMDCASTESRKWEPTLCAREC